MAEALPGVKEPALATTCGHLRWGQLPSATLRSGYRNGARRTEAVRALGAEWVVFVIIWYPNDYLHLYTRHPHALALQATCFAVRGLCVDFLLWLPYC